VEWALDRTSGLDKAVPKVALVECSNPLPEVAFTVPVVEGSEVGLATVLRSNSPNNIKLRARTPNSATPKRVLRGVLSTLTNVANNTGSKSLPVPLLFHFLLLFVPFPPLLLSLCFLLAANLSSSAFLTVPLIVVVFSSSCNTQITVITLLFLQSRTV